MNYLRLETIYILEHSYFPNVLFISVLALLCIFEMAEMVEIQEHYL